MNSLDTFISDLQQQTRFDFIEIIFAQPGKGLWESLPSNPSITYSEQSEAKKTGDDRMAFGAYVSILTGSTHGSFKTVSYGHLDVIGIKAPDRDNVFVILLFFRNLTNPPEKLLQILKLAASDLSTLKQCCKQDNE